MNFTDYKYTRPDVTKINEFLNKKINELKTAKPQEQINIINEVENKTIEVFSMMELVNIRSSINTTDEFYNEEMNYINENGPLLEDGINDFNNAVITYVKRDLLVKHFGELYVKKLENSLKLFAKEIIPFLQEENNLVMQYTKLISNLKVKLFNQELTLTEARAYTEDKDRKIRKEAYLAIQNEFAKNETEFDTIYDKLIKVRHNIAVTLGFKNYVEYKYLAFERFDYSYKDVANYREQIVDVVVPLATKLRQARKNRLGLDELYVYDGIKFKNGNPRPIGSPDELVAKASQMYSEMNKETGEFFNLMTSTKQMDLLSKPGKAPGGFCTYIPYFRTPFIFANFNGTSADVDVLTHEAGHAFQVYCARDLISAYHWPTMEACEIHSMSMEFLAWPWMENFFADNANKYRFMHLEDALTFLPYGCLVDHFQEEALLNPNWTPEERKQLWCRLEKMYLPHINYDDDAFGKKGTRWYAQHHIFAIPLYYIDYTLAQVCAFQFWHLDQSDHASTLERYIKLCKLGGSQTFLNLLKSVNLINPMANNNLKKIIEPVANYLEKRMNNIED